MYKLMAFTTKASKKDIEIVDTCLKFLESDNIKRYNIPTHRLSDHITNNTLVIAFGTYAQQCAKDHVNNMNLSNVKIIPLASPQNLAKSVANKLTRQEAFIKLKELKSFIKTDLFQPVKLQITEADLPDLDAKQLLLLTKLTKEAEKTTCFQTTKNGKLIEISEEQLDNSQADIHLTFTELYTIRAIMDVLQISEVNLVTTSKNNST